MLLGGGALWSAHHYNGFLDFWAEWNYSGYQDTSPSSTKPKPYAEYKQLMDTMGALPPGRAMWEGGQALDTYGTSLALMLLPYWTNGRIGSMEGLYYESAATTPYHFMAVAPLSGPGNASNPVRGLDYRSLEDFDLGVRYLRLLGVRYYMAYSAEAKARAADNPGLRLVDQVPDRDGAAPSGWDIYEVRGSKTVSPLRYEPVVVEPEVRDAVGVLRPQAGDRARRIRSSAPGSAWPRAGGTIPPRSTGRSPRVARRAGPGSRRRGPTPRPGAGSRR